jgi:hypothetical protein
VEVDEDVDGYLVKGALVAAFSQDAGEGGVPEILDQQQAGGAILGQDGRRRLVPPL